MNTIIGTLSGFAGILATVLALCGIAVVVDIAAKAWQGKRDQRKYREFFDGR